jgi:hypothetical protein
MNIDKELSEIGVVKSGNEYMVEPTPNELFAIHFANALKALEESLKARVRVIKQAAIQLGKEPIIDANGKIIGWI